MTKPPLEKTIINRILRWLNSLEGGRAIKLHVSRHGVRGTPDILFVYKGRAYFFEVKRPGMDARPSQQAELVKWDKAGATAVVVRSLDEVKGIIKYMGGFKR